MQQTSSIDEGRRRLEQRRTLNAITQRIEDREFQRLGAHLYAVPHVHEEQLQFMDSDDDWPAA